MKWLYGVVELPWDQGSELLVLPRPVAVQQARWIKVLSSGTWGDLRDVATAEEYAEVLERAGYGSFEGFSEHLSTGRPIPGSVEVAADAFATRSPNPPGDDQDFLPRDQIPSHADGDFPPDVHYLMNVHLPTDVVRAYGEAYETVFNGTYARFTPEVIQDLVSALEQRGFEVEEDMGLLAEAVQPL